MGGTYRGRDGDGEQESKARGSSLFRVERFGCDGKRSKLEEGVDGAEGLTAIDHDTSSISLCLSYNLYLVSLPAVWRGPCPSQLAASSCVFPLHLLPLTSLV